MTTSLKIIVFCAAPKWDEAERIAQILVEERLAACVNVLPNLRSIYRWEGRIVQDDEFLLLIKTEERLFTDVRDRIKALHSYRVPEIIAIPLVQGSEEYLDWIATSVR